MLTIHPLDLQGVGPLIGVGYYTNLIIPSFLWGLCPFLGDLGRLC